jgi:hemoglobin-like flavoprotein
MDTNAIVRIRTSFQLLAPRGQELIDTFYQMLFTAAPGVRGLFPADMTKQKGHLLGAVGLVVKHADNLAAIEGPLMDMGERHVKYGAKAEHYPVVRDTLIAALAVTAGPAWNPQLADDWTEALNAVAGLMIRGAQRAELRQAA